MKLLCFRPTRKMHDSGYRYIEYGYFNTEDSTVEIVDRYDAIISPFGEGVYFNIDLDKSGWFRIMPRNKEGLEWSYGGMIEAKEDINISKENQLTWLILIDKLGWSAKTKPKRKLAKKGK